MSKDTDVRFIAFESEGDKHRALEELRRRRISAVDTTEAFPEEDRPEFEAFLNEHPHALGVLLPKRGPQISITEIDDALRHARDTAAQSDETMEA